MRKQIISFALTAALISCAIGTVAGATEESMDFALNNQIVEYVNAQVVDSYSEYYTIPSIQSEIIDIAMENGQTVATVNCSFTKILKAQSSSQMPYIQGLTNVASQMTGSEKEKLDNYINVRKKELDELYIGKPQTENAAFTVTVDSLTTYSSSDNNFDIAFKDDFGGTYSMDEFRPLSTDELIEKGQVDAYQIAESENGSVIPYATTRNSARQYNRVWARDYARIYTDNTGGNSTENYNPDYSYFYGDDCANFVSQCIRYGGIGTDSVWYPYSTAWKFGGGPAGTDGGLCDYMSENDLFFRCNEESKAFAGSIICWTSYEHVGIVDQNDTVTMTFCAHTNNRLSVSFKGYSDVTFYIPCWDSVANQWTPQ